MIKLLTSKWTWAVIWTTGFGLLGGYLVVSADWRISVPWALGYVAISVSVAWLFVGLKLHDRFPKLDRYLLYPQHGDAQNSEITRDQAALANAEYVDAGLRSKVSLVTPAEDGLICVPVLLVGITPASAAIGGIVFGLLHLARFSYLDCAGKALFYGLVCYFVLPHGVLTVAFGHIMMNAIAFLGLQVAKRKLSDKLRPNSMPHPDARTSAALDQPPSARAGGRGR